MERIENFSGLLFNLFLLLAISAAPAVASTSFPPVQIDKTSEVRIAEAPETGLPMRLKPGKYQVVKLDQPVGNIKTDLNPQFVTAVVYDQRSVALFPHRIGASHVTVTDQNGKTLMARYVIVSDPNEKYVRLHKICAKGRGRSCESTKVYYCPNLCYETTVISAAEK